MSELYNEYTGEITREVICKITSVLGEDKYQMDFGGQTIEGTAKNEGQKFEVGDNVIVLVPMEENTKVNYILSKTEEESNIPTIPNYEEEEEEEEVTTYLEKTYFPIKDYKYDENISFLGNSSSTRQYIKINSRKTNEELNEFLSQQYNILKFSCNIKVDFTDNDFDHKEFYGVSLIIPCIDKDNNIVKKEIPINSDTLYGNPYRLNEYSYQYTYFTFEEGIKIDKNSHILLKFYSENFDNKKNYYISIKDIQFSIGFEAIKGSNQYKLYIKDTDETSPNLFILKPELYLDGVKIQVFDNKKILWFLEDYSVTPNSDTYVENAGISWRCVNGYSIANNKRQFKSQESYEINDEYFNRVKCLIENSEGRLLAYSIYTVGTEKGKDYCDVYVENHESKIIQKDSGYLNIIVKIKKRLLYWGWLSFTHTVTLLRYDKNNNYIENSKVYMTRFKSDSEYSYYRVEEKDYYNHIKYGIDSSSIDTQNTFKINIQLGQENINKEFTLKIENNLMYKLEIINLDGTIHSVNYKFDISNKSPSAEGYNGNNDSLRDKIIPITYKLYDYDGKEVQSVSSQTWNIRNNFIESVGGNTEKEFKYKIKDNVSFTFEQSTKPSIILEVKYNEQTIRKEADIYFSKEGECGTYGDKVNFAVMPSNDYSLIDDINDESINREQLTLAYYQGKLYCYSALKGRYVSLEDEKIRFYPVLWDNHKIVNPSSFSSSVDIEVVDYEIDDTTKEKENDRYTNSCIKIDEVRDEYNGFTLSLRGDSKRKIGTLPTELSKRNYSNFDDYYGIRELEGINFHRTGTEETREDRYGVEEKYIDYSYYRTDRYDHKDRESIEHCVINLRTGKSIPYKELLRKEEFKYQTTGIFFIPTYTTGYTYVVSHNDGSIGYYDSREYYLADTGWLPERIESKNRLIEMPTNLDENINIIKFKINYNKKSYEYNYPLNLFITTIHPDLLPKIINDNEISKTGISNIDIGLLSKPNDELFGSKFNYELAKYNYGFDGNYNYREDSFFPIPTGPKYENFYIGFNILESISKILPIASIRYLYETAKDTSKLKGKFREIALGLDNNNTNLGKLNNYIANTNNKIGTFNSKLDLYNKQLNNFKSFCSSLKCNYWLEKLKEVNNCNITKDELVFYITDIKKQMTDLGNFLNLYEDIKNDEKYKLFELNEKYLKRVNEAYDNLIKKNYISEKDKMNFDKLDRLEGINYNWNEYEDYLSEKYDMSILSAIKQYISWIEKSIESYQYTYDIFIQFKNINFEKNYNTITKELDNSANILENENRYIKIYKAIKEAIKDYSSYNKLDELYSFIQNLYNNYLTDLCYLKGDNIIISDKELAKYERLIKENSDAINYYKEAIDNCNDLLDKDKNNYYMARYISSINIEQ